ncbi:MAG: hypothetical protein IJ415_01840, partial [Clostridia bacterium]|nr:hypothetical protein [Clostridia bacterium]
ENVNFYDVIEISLVINKNAINAIDNNAYDLSLGLILSSVQISGQLGSFTLVETGVYSIKFNMKEFMPETGVDINIIYSLKIKSKTINVTSIVSNSTSFYENYKMFINAKDAGFESATIESINNATNLKYDLQFLAKANVYSVFTTEAYISGFVVSGVKIYCEGLEISSNEYSIYGIEVNTNWVVSARLLYNLDVVFKVQPIMTYNGGPNFTKTFSCDDEGNANSQTLTMGIYASFDIQVNEMISSCIKIQYKSTEANSYYVDNVTNAGTYNVTMSFSNVSGYDWFEDIEITDVVTLTILPKDIFLTYDATRITKSEKIYDGTSNWNVEQVYSALKFVDNANLSISYATLLNSGNSNLKLSNVMGYITAGGKDDITTQANEEVYYNLYLYNLSLKASAYNNNFKLNTSDLVILNCIKITKRKIDLTALYVYDKVYDGTTNAEVASTSQNVQILNKIEGDNLTIDIEKLIVTFESNAIGTNKKVLINATNALGGSDVENYYINDLT